MLILKTPTLRLQSQHHREIFILFLPLNFSNLYYEMLGIVLEVYDLCSCSSCTITSFFVERFTGKLTPKVCAENILTKTIFSKETRWLYVVLIMIIFWATEALPHPVTSLIPIGLFPLLGVKVNY